MSSVKLICHRPDCFVFIFLWELTLKQIFLRPEVILRETNIKITWSRGIRGTLYMSWKLISIFLGKDDSKETEICTTIRKQSHEANYFECNKPVVGSFLNITLTRGPRRQFVLCEVEVFQTKIGEYVLPS